MKLSLTHNKHIIAGLMIVLIMSVALAACGGDSGSSGNSSANSGLSNADLLKKAAADMKALKSYNIDANATTSGLQIAFNADLDVANNKSNVTMNAMGMNISAVIIGSDAYLSSDGGKTFTKSDASSSGIGSFDSLTKMWNNFNPADVDKAASALKDGTPRDDMVDGTATRHISGNASDLAGLAASLGSSGDATTTMSGTVEMWISTDDNPTVRQIKEVGSTAGQDINATIKWSKFNQTFDIKPPATSSELDTPFSVVAIKAGK